MKIWSRRKETSGLTFAVAKARGEYVRSHFKNTREVAAAVSGA